MANKLHTNQSVRAGRILASVLLAGLVAILINARDKNDTGSSFLEFYVRIAIIIICIIWGYIEFKHHFKK